MIASKPPRPGYIATYVIQLSANGIAPRYVQRVKHPAETAFRDDARRANDPLQVGRAGLRTARSDNGQKRTEL